LYIPPDFLGTAAPAADRSGYAGFLPALLILPLGETLSTAVWCTPKILLGWVSAFRGTAPLGVAKEEGLVGCAWG
jgi:hypothetical protein